MPTFFNETKTIGNGRDPTENRAGHWRVGGARPKKKKTYTHTKKYDRFERRVKYIPILILTISNKYIRVEYVARTTRIVYIIINFVRRQNARPAHNFHYNSTHFVRSPRTTSAGDR